MSSTGLRPRHYALAVAAALLIASSVGAAADDAAVMTLRATAVAPAAGTLTISLFRWPTNEERAPLVAAMAPPAESPSAPARGAAAGPGGRAGRGGRGGGGAVPASPTSRLSAAVKAAPTCGYIWAPA
jgi:hypothetical protein